MIANQFLHSCHQIITIAFDQASVVKYINISFNRTIIESVFIKYFSGKLYNIHSGPYVYST